MKTIYLFLFLGVLTAQKVVKNTLEDIEKCKDKLELKLVEEWGGWEEEKYLDGIYLRPAHLEFDSRGNIYILDDTKQEIYIFDKNKKFRNKIFRKGDGPGELRGANIFAIDKNDNVVVVANGKFTLEAYTNNGKYNSIKMSKGDKFKGILTYGEEILLVNGERYLGGKPLLKNYNLEGNLLKTHFKGLAKSFDGDHTTNPIIRAVESFKDIARYEIDDNGNILIGQTFFTPQIKIFNSKLEEKMLIEYNLPFKIKKTDFGINNWPDVLLLDLQFYNKKIFALTKKRALTTEDTKRIEAGNSIATSGTESKKLEDTKVKEYKRNLNDEGKTDLYQLLVFNEDGKIIAQKNLDVFAERIKYHDNKIYIVDKYVAEKIYVYEMKFK